MVSQKHGVRAYLIVDVHCDVKGRRHLRNEAQAFVRSGTERVGRSQPLNVLRASPLQSAIAPARSSRLGHNLPSFIYASQEGFVSSLNGSGAASACCGNNRRSFRCHVFCRRCSSPAWSRGRWSPGCRRCWRFVHRNRRPVPPGVGSGSGGGAKRQGARPANLAVAAPGFCDDPIRRGFGLLSGPVWDGRGEHRSRWRLGEQMP
jgi:hypothetical protein